MAIPLEDELYAQVLGWEVLKYLKRDKDRLQQLCQETDRTALRILEEIQRILDDDSLEDPECFERIERIVQVFFAHDISTTRHDWG